jgi:4a-hydroxytetrahydrobiopterin dehydratase
MTEALAYKTCTPCRGGIPPLTREQAELFHAQAPAWQLLEEAHRIERSFRFRNFREALTFVQEIGELAETEGHHPNISFGWGNATVSLQTKKIKGLHETTSSWPPRLTACSLARPRRNVESWPKADYTGRDRNRSGYSDVLCQAPRARLERSPRAPA